MIEVITGGIFGGNFQWKCDFTLLYIWENSIVQNHWGWSRRGSVFFSESWWLDFLPIVEFSIILSTFPVEKAIMCVFILLLFVVLTPNWKNRWDIAKSQKAQILYCCWFFNLIENFGLLTIVVCHYSLASIVLWKMKM